MIDLTTTEEPAWVALPAHARLRAERILAQAMGADFLMLLEMAGVTVPPPNVAPGPMVIDIPEIRVRLATEAELAAAAR